MRRSRKGMHTCAFSCLGCQGGSFVTITCTRYTVFALSSSRKSTEACVLHSCLARHPARRTCSYLIRPCARGRSSTKPYPISAYFGPDLNKVCPIWTFFFYVNDFLVDCYTLSMMVRTTLRAIGGQRMRPRNTQQRQPWHPGNNYHSLALLLLTKKCSDQPSASLRT